MSIVSKERDLGDDVLVISPSGRHSYTEDYKTKIFLIWYRNSKPGGRRLRELVEPDEINGVIPSAQLLSNWIADFKNSAIMLDDQVARELQDRMVAEKVEMLNRHAKIGVDLQDKAAKYLDEHEDELKVPFAVKMLVEGIRIERESRGVPQALEKMMSRSDEDLLKEVMNLVNKAPVEFEQIESSIEIDNGEEND